MISPDSCGQLVAGNYDIIVGNEPTLRSVITDYLNRFQHFESEIGQPDFNYLDEFKLLKEFSKALKEDKDNLKEGEQDFNLRKNRYKDIIPFSHTRVVLSSTPDELGSCYINANYIRGPSGSPRAYIACQGPLSCTLVDFWRMIWETGVSVVVMACNEYESGKPKCELYWPEEVDTSVLYGNFQVTLLKERQVCSDFLVRKFSVKFYSSDVGVTSSSTTVNPSTATPSTSISDNINSINNRNSDNDSGVWPSTRCQSENLNNVYYPNNNSNPDSTPSSESSACAESQGSGREMNNLRCYERTICQFHYTTWPDHGAPDSVQPILELVRLMREVQPSEDRPILVHCSAGCGRTGTICCIDYVWGLLRSGKIDINFDLCSIISDMRQQRMAMVQTLEQYILCHRTVAALFLNQLKLIDDHVYENLDFFEDVRDAHRPESDAEDELGPVFI